MSKGKEISSKLVKPLSLLIKVLVVGFAFWYIYKEVFLKENINDIVSEFKSITSNANVLWVLLITVLLMFLNWGIESYKWKLMISKIEDVTFAKAYVAVLTGVTVSFFTPNRVGEFGGRVFHLNKGNKIKAILITVLGGMSQLLVTIVVGLVSLLFFLKGFFERNLYLYYTVLSVVVVFIAFALLMYFNTRLLTYFLNKIKALNKYHEYTKVFSYYKLNELSQILLLSVARYVVFTVQFYLLLKILSVNISLINAFEMISIVFLVMATIPTIALTEIGVRGSVAVYFIGALSANTFGILTASFSLWIINLVIPAIIGSVFVFYLKLFKE